MLKIVLSPTTVFSCAHDAHHPVILQVSVVSKCRNVRIFLFQNALGWARTEIISLVVADSGRCGVCGVNV
jgi:hypothetical protein